MLKPNWQHNDFSSRKFNIVRNRQFHWAAKKLLIYFSSSSSSSLIYPSPHLGLTPQGLTSQMPVGQMPVGGSTVSGPEH